MAASQTEPFPPLDTTASTAAVAPATTTASDTSSLLRPAVSPRADLLPFAAVSPKSGKTALSPRATPVALTGAAALGEIQRRKQQTSAPMTASNARQTTPNPGVQVMQSLLGGPGLSKASDAPASDKLSEPLRKAAEKMHVTDHNSANGEGEQQVSPVSLSSFGTVEHAGTGHTMTATASDASGMGPHFVAEPGQMADGTNYLNTNGSIAADEQDGSKAFSYPGPPQMMQGQDSGPSRGMSLPGFGQPSPKSPASNKRHKCPYCSTDFTRHHNLKSHLLTHSQEKPFVCDTCQARFRRLHDLKRHTKLHTGERPHTCDKCGRRFARGDALARHNKGPGGCAGRRSSFGGDDEYGPDGGDAGAMEGVEYLGPDDDDDGDDSRPHGRRISEPNRKRQQLETSQDSSRQVYRQHSSTYPPAPSRDMRGSVSGGGMAPPTVVHPGTSNANSPHDLSGQPSPAGGPSLTSSYYGSGQVFAEPGTMTPSPKPLSPGHTPNEQHRLSAPDTSASVLSGRNRSISLSTQLQQAHFGRASTARTPPQVPAQFPPNQPGGGTLLPPLGSSNSAQPRGGMHSSISAASAPNMVHQGQMQHGAAHVGGQGSNAGSLSSHGRSSGGSMRELAGPDADVWTYVRSLEERMSRMHDEHEMRVSRLQDEWDLRLSRLQKDVISLKNASGYGADLGTRY